MSSGHPPVGKTPSVLLMTDRSLTLQAPMHQAPCSPLGACLPAEKSFFILVQICLLALFPH